MQIQKKPYHFLDRKNELIIIHAVQNCKVLMKPLFQGQATITGVLQKLSHPIAKPSLPTLHQGPDNLVLLLINCHIQLNKIQEMENRMR